MAEDQYANYVLKKAMDAIDQGEQRVQMFDTLADSLTELVSFVWYFSII